MVRIATLKRKVSRKEMRRLRESGMPIQERFKRCFEVILEEGERIDELPEVDR